MVGRSKATAAIDMSRQRTSLLSTTRKEEDAVAVSRPVFVPKHEESVVEKANTEASEKEKPSQDIYTTPTPPPSEDATWLEKAVAEVINKFS